MREITDELETSRYNNSQLQRELKALNERHSRAFQKSANDLKSKEDEVRLLYIRFFLFFGPCFDYWSGTRLIMSQKYL